jgi:hypothetical protein
MQRIDARTLFRWLLSLIFVGGVAACVNAPPPYEEYVLARSAIRAAQDVESSRYATGLWGKAEENFREGQRLYKENDFKEAKTRFQLAIQFAEKAENATRLKKFQSGDTVP